MERTIELPGGPASDEPDSAFFVGNATLVLRLAGMTLLTDPNFLHAGDHAHIGYGMTARRLRDPAIEFEELPSIDAVLLSHYHGDHFDQIVEKRLRPNMPIITTAHASKTLARKGFGATVPLESWDRLTMRKGSASLAVTALPGKHGPGFVASLLPPVMGQSHRLRTARSRDVPHVPQR